MRFREGVRSADAGYKNKRSAVDSGMEEAEARMF